MIEKFINYAFYGEIVGKEVKMIENAYMMYCKLFEIEEVDNIVNRICNENNLYIEKGVIVK